MTTSNKFQGVYAGVVISTRDPQNRGRVRVRVPQILGTASSDWAEPMGAINTPPALGERVNIQFLGGDVTRPVFSVFDPTKPWEGGIADLAAALADLLSYPTAWTLLPIGPGYAWESDLGYEPAWRWEREGTVEMRGTFFRDGGPNKVIRNSVICKVPLEIRPQKYAYGVGASQINTYSDHVRLEVVPKGIAGSPGEGDLVVRYWTESYQPDWVGLDGFRYDIV